jgi:formylglycine-generating enzyme required for sulfatase activity
VSRRASIVAAALLAGAGLGAAAWLTLSVRRDGARMRAFTEGRIPLRIVNPAGPPVRLFRVGDTPRGHDPIEPSEGETWLEPGNYFVERATPGAVLRYPVPLRGFRRGPDEGGSFAVTVRALHAEAPPSLPGQRFVPVPGGHVAIGLAGNPGERHYVWVPTFFVGAYEVSNAEFRAFLADPDGAAARANWTEEGWAWRTGTPAAATALLTPADPEYARFGQDDQPVVLVSWFEAHAFGRWLTRHLRDDRWEYRLPTEAEWEKAARGPESFDYGLGPSLSEPEAPLYNWRKNPGATVTVVGTAATDAAYRPNGYGVYHASGNVAEWILSRARPYNRDHPYRDDDRNHAEGLAPRTTRGGSWYSATASRLLVGYREEFQPSLRSNDLGFRIAVVPNPAMARRGR